MFDKSLTRGRLQSSSSILTSTQTPQQLPLLLSEMNSPGDIHDRKKNIKRFFVNAPTFLIILILVTTSFSFLYVVASLESTVTEWRKRDSNSRGGNLFLTPIINNGNLSRARELAEVNLFHGIISYSGFLTVDEACKSHLFFWFFPSDSGNTSAPLILWHGGGPGTSALFALFEGTGPIRLNDDGLSWVENKYSWTQSHSMLYLDSPVGSGFSYTEGGESCYASSSDDVADSVVTALRQFFLIFPEYLKSDFFISSSSYGGKFIPMIARRIDDDNELDLLSGNPKSGLINLKGLISMSGFSDPLHQIDYGEFYFNMGIINGVQMKHFQIGETRARSFIRSKDYLSAYEIIDPLVVGTAESPSYLKNATGINHPFNFYEDMRNPIANFELYKTNNFLNLQWVQKAIHADSSVVGRDFSVSSNQVYDMLRRDIYKSVSYAIEDLLDKGYKFLFTSGQFDLIVPHTTIFKFLNELKWGGGFDFRDAGNYWYKFNDTIVGYGKSTGNLTYIMLRNMGHHPFIDRPDLTQDMIVRFTSNVSSLYFQ